jgi:hypothetical protein
VGWSMAMNKISLIDDSDNESALGRHIKKFTAKIDQHLNRRAYQRDVDELWVGKERNIYFANV